MPTTKKPAKTQSASKRSGESMDASDKLLADLLKRLRETADPDEITRLSERIEQVIFNRK